MVSSECAVHKWMLEQILEMCDNFKMIETGLRILKWEFIYCGIVVISVCVCVCVCCIKWSGWRNERIAWVCSIQI